MKYIATLAARQGINPARLAVGNRANSINPRTGQREFDDGLGTIVVNGIRPKPVRIPRITLDYSSAPSVFGRGGQPSDEGFADDILAQAASEGYFNPASLFRSNFEGETTDSLKTTLNTLKNIKRIVEALGVAAASDSGYKMLASSLARVGLTAILRAGLPGLMIVVTGTTIAYLVDSTIALLEVMIEERGNGGDATPGGGGPGGGGGAPSGGGDNGIPEERLPNMIG